MTRFTDAGCEQFDGKQKFVFEATTVKNFYYLDCHAYHQMMKKAKNERQMTK